MSAMTDTLRSRISTLEVAQHLDAPVLRYCPTPFQAFNQDLPGGGLPVGALTEIVSERQGHGALEMALLLASGALNERPVWMLIEDSGRASGSGSASEFFPPSLLPQFRTGNILSRLIHIRANGRKGGWAFTQALRCPEVSVAIYSTSSRDHLQQRRFQLAAARGGTVGILLRPMTALKRACWVALRLKVEPLPAADPRLRQRHFLAEIIKGAKR